MKTLTSIGMTWRCVGGVTHAAQAFRRSVVPYYNVFRLSLYSLCIDPWLTLELVNLLSWCLWLCVRLFVFVAFLCMLFGRIRTYTVTNHDEHIWGEVLDKVVGVVGRNWHSFLVRIQRPHSSTINSEIIKFPEFIPNILYSSVISSSSSTFGVASDKIILPNGCHIPLYGKQ